MLSGLADPFPGRAGSKSPFPRSFFVAFSSTKGKGATRSPELSQRSPRPRELASALAVITGGLCPSPAGRWVFGWSPGLGKKRMAGAGRRNWGEGERFLFGAGGRCQTEAPVLSGRGNDPFHGGGRSPTHARSPSASSRIPTSKTLNISERREAFFSLQTHFFPYKPTLMLLLLSFLNDFSAFARLTHDCLLVARRKGS